MKHERAADVSAASFNVYLLSFTNRWIYLKDPTTDNEWFWFYLAQASRWSDLIKQLYILRTLEPSKFDPVNK